MAGDHADPGHPKPYGCRPPRHTPQPHSRRTPRRTDTRRRTLDTWTLRRPHRTLVTWTGPVRHRTLAPDTGHRMPDTNADTVNDSTAGIRTPLAAMPSDRTLRRAPVLCPRTTRQPLGRLAGQAAPRRTAVLGRLRVERRASGLRSSVMASASAGGCCGVLRGAGSALAVDVDGLTVPARMSAVCCASMDRSACLADGHALWAAVV